MTSRQGPLHPFHLAFPVRDIATTRAFYVDVLGCKVGRSAERWIDFDLFGHQLSAHVAEHAETTADPVTTNDVDGDDVPVRHFGLVLPWEPWHALRDRLYAVNVSFLIAPHIRFVGEPPAKYSKYSSVEGSGRARAGH